MDEWDNGQSATAAAAAAAVSAMEAHADVTDRCVTNPGAAKTSTRNSMHARLSCVASNQSIHT